MTDTPKPITDEMLAEWESLCKEATPGPWEHKCDALGYGVINERLEQAIVRDGMYTDAGRELGMTHSEYNTKSEVLAIKTNFDFIAASRTALPALIAEVRKLRDELQRKRCEYKLMVDRLLEQGVQLSTANKCNFELRQRIKELEVGADGQH